MILGLRWKELHNPQISWSEKQLTHWSSYCQNHYLQVPNLTLAFTANEIPECHQDVTILPEYHHLGEIFRETNASRLPSHWPHDVLFCYFQEPPPADEFSLY